MKILKITKKFIKTLGGWILNLPFWPESLYYFGFNGRVALEVTNSCNLKCRLCPTWQYMKRPRGFMKLEQFKKIIDDNADIFKRINMIFAGEPLLNPEVFSMVKYAQDRGIGVLVSTNATLLDEKKIEQVISSGLNNLIVCLDGTTKEIHEQYRQGSDFEQTKENIRQLCRYKKQSGQSYPYITLQFLVMKQNEHQIPDIIELAKDLGVDSLDLKALSLGSFVSLDRKIELAENNLPNDQNFSRFYFKGGKLRDKSKPRICSWMRQALILFNGDVSLCCYDVDGDLVVGNIFKDGGFKKIYRSSKYRKWRKKAIQRKIGLCQRCNYSSGFNRSIIFNPE